MSSALTEPSAGVMLRRRACLQGLGIGALAWLGAGAALPAIAATQQSEAASFAACWMDSQGLHHAGWLQLGRQGQVTVLHAIELPTRGHGLALLPDGALLVVARRPGDWLLRLSRGQKPQWLWQEGDRVFSGHVAVAADGKTVFTTEIDTDSGQGLLGVRDAGTLEKRAEYATNGMDPHAVLALPARTSVANRPAGSMPHPLTGMLFVANGGIDTATETGRIKRHLQRMDPSIACLHPATGELQGQWRLEDSRLSLRHLAWAWPERAGATRAAAHWPVLGIALQAEHDDATQKAAAPLLATLSWDKNPDGQLQVAAQQPALAGYGGDVSVAGRGPDASFVVSATRGNALVYFSLDGQFQDSQALPEAGALARGDGKLWAAGRPGLAHMPSTSASAMNQALSLSPWTAARVDNHWLSL